ncbi:MAG TPA: ferredoxin family protein [Burkholderiales bacterium]
MVFIDADACIDCCACIPACPVQAIYMDYDLPSEKARWLETNRMRAAALPGISRPAEPLSTAEAKRTSLGF